MVILVALLAACSSQVAEGGRIDSLRQVVELRRYRVQPPKDIFIVMNVEASDEGRALVAGATRALRERVERLARGETPHLRDVWNPIDVRGFVANIADGTLRSARDDLELAWTESNATREGAERFAAAMERALATPSTEPPRRKGIVAMLDSTLSAAGGKTDDRGRLIIVLTTEDDILASPENDAFVGDGGEDQVILVHPSCRAEGAPRLAAWARSNAAQVTCNVLDISSYTTYAVPCLPPSAGERTSCHVYAYVRRGVACYGSHAWRTPPVPVAASEPELEGMTACEVLPVEGSDLGRCEDGFRRYDGRSSGWCMPRPNPWCPAPVPRIVGGAAPPWATMKVICER